MATLVLQTAGQAVGGAIAGPLGAAIGRAAGGIAGSIVDQALFGPPPRQVEGPRLASLHVTGSTEGAAIPAVWGRMRLAGQLIWACPFEEEVTHRSQGGGKGSLSRPTAEYTEYVYYASFAIGLCEGQVDRIGRVWADGKEINPAQFTWRLHAGTEDQQPDSLIEAKEGAGNAPAYRGLAYVVFERMPLARFGNRLPQLSFEVFRGLDGFERSVRSVNIIPGSTEFGYDTQQVRREDGFGGTETENVHSFGGKADFAVSLDQLQATCPNVSSVNLVVAWFGNDLRCSECTVEPCTDNADKQTEPVSWSVAGLNRQSARLVSRADGRAAYGGTPDDGSVRRAIEELKARGLEVCFYPFVLMDIPSGNMLASPYGGVASQPAYPWRGQISCMPAVGEPGSVDGTPAARVQVDAFFGTAQRSDFSIAGEAIVYAGLAQWSYRRMILHYAHLCAQAGGVESFLIGSEMVGLNRVRDETGAFPAVAHLKALAADVAAVLPGAKISYAADWSEYAGYRPDDGSGDVWHHLDGLWADPNIHFIGIDNYMPLSDWRAGGSHADRQAGWASIHDRNYLISNVAGGEGFDWYYASYADRVAQARTPIADIAYGKHWVFRVKDIRGWWENQHYNRPGGVEEALPTGWQPMSKPVRFTEIGVPAVDKGANQPNVFVDAKSAASALPYFSSGNRDDLIQRAGLDAIHRYWAVETGNNPVSPIYGGPMVDVDRMGIWAWDARPFPAFPYLEDIWSDGVNHARGHWLNGRMGALELKALVAAICERAGFASIDVSGLSGMVEGFIIDRPMAARGAIEALSRLFLFDVVECGGVLAFRHPQIAAPAGIASERLCLVREDQSLVEVRRTQETEMPAAISLQYADSGTGYAPASVSARRAGTSSGEQSAFAFPGVLGFAEAQGHVRRVLNVAWAGREAAVFSLPPSLTALEPGDVVRLPEGAAAGLWRLLEITDAGHRRVTAVRHDGLAYDLTAGEARQSAVALPVAAGRVSFAVLDLPLLTGSEDPHAPWVAVAARPWPGQAFVYRLQGEASFSTDLVIASPAVMGRTLDPLGPGRRDLWDRAGRFRVRLTSGELASRAVEDVLAGANTALVGDAIQGREVLQFLDARLVAPRTWELSGLLRAQAGTEQEMEAGWPAGTQFVLFDPSVRQLTPSPSNIGRQYDLRIGPAGVDPADPLMQDFSFAFSGRGLRPLSPVHARAMWNGPDLELSWIRRTRIGGDSWELAEVPLAEEAEAYEIDVIHAGSVVRTIAASQTSAVYAASDQVADFAGPLPTDLSFNIHQVSPVHGRGAPAKVSLS